MFKLALVVLLSFAALALLLFALFTGSGILAFLALVLLAGSLVTAFRGR